MCNVGLERDAKDSNTEQDSRSFNYTFDDTQDPCYYYTCFPEKPASVAMNCFSVTLLSDCICIPIQIRCNKILHTIFEQKPLSSPRKSEKLKVGSIIPFTSLLLVHQKNNESTLNYPAVNLCKLLWICANSGCDLFIRPNLAKCKDQFGMEWYSNDNNNNNNNFKLTYLFILLTNHLQHCTYIIYVKIVALLYQTVF